MPRSTVVRRAGRAPKLLERVKGKEVDDRADLLGQVLAGEEVEPPEREHISACTVQKDEHIDFGTMSSSIFDSHPQHQCVAHHRRFARFSGKRAAI